VTAITDQLAQALRGLIEQTKRCFALTESEERQKVAAMDDARAALAAYDAALSAAPEQPVRYMPIMKTPFSIPFDLLNEQQALANHSQSLARLAQRGGLAAQEALAIVNRRRWNEYEHITRADALAALIAAATPKQDQQ
jgi:hypothetical protein